MGRGRQKAKHTKVARDLKYFSPDTNYGALQKELGSAPPPVHSGEWPEYEQPEYEDVYGDDEDDDEDEDDESETVDFGSSDFGSGIAEERKGA